VDDDVLGPHGAEDRGALPRKVGLELLEFARQPHQAEEPAGDERDHDREADQPLLHDGGSLSRPHAQAKLLGAGQREPDVLVDDDVDELVVRRPLAA